MLRESADQKAAGAGAIGERFTLTGATGGPATGSASANAYILDANLEALRGNVNRQVRVTGVLDRGTDSPSESQRVRVESVEPVGGSCAVSAR